MEKNVTSNEVNRTLIDNLSKPKSVNNGAKTYSS